MARKSSPTLTEAELRIMRVLWSRGESTNLEIVDSIPSPRLARNTVMTTLGVLERKGYVSHRADGRTFIYRALIAEDAVQGNVLENVVQRFFNGSAQDLVIKLLDAEYISPAERKRIQELLEKATDE
ncbi:MAG TPA: BlaI/MecI/CopY family transcriptional regulator [Candidatus Baltobacteraceae bacterium]|jgi:predicted transcriptional regulator|nr:BlaI/MecI/CopY family transcriptional regulator [Candidatus Baltobacteraceae bacterium]